MRVPDACLRARIVEITSLENCLQMSDHHDKASYERAAESLLHEIALIMLVNLFDLQ